MIKIYIGNIAALSDGDIFRKYVELLDETRKNKVWGCKQEEDKKRSLLAGYLIQVGVKEWIKEKSGLQADATPLSLSYVYGADGKPYLRDHRDIHFSLSHSGMYVAAAFSTEEVGIDIQEHRELKTDIAGRFFSAEDQELLEKTENRKDSFYRMWAVKEAYMKLTGEGMRQGMNAAVMEAEGEHDITILSKGIIRKKEKNNSAYFRIYDNIKGYSIAVCSYKQAADSGIKEIKLA